MLIAFACIIVYFLFTSFFGFYTIIKPSKIISSVTPETLKLDYEDVSFTTSDNLVLRGWWIPTNTENAKTIILLHGYPADKGDILPSMSFLNKTYNLLLFDFRYSGQSEGKYSTLGAKETIDLSSALLFLKSRGITEVGIWGFSVGGAVALMTAPDSLEIKAIISESSYASLDEMAPELYRVPLLKYPLAYLTRLWALLILGTDLQKVSPVRSAENISIPVFIIHSKDDDVIPFRHALLIQEALKENLRAEFWFEEGLTHGVSGPAYQKRITDFFQRNL